MPQRVVLPTDHTQRYVENQEEEEALRTCLQEMDVRRLTLEEERELSVRVLAGDEQAVWTLVLHNRKLVVSIAKRYRGRGMTLLDLIQEGTFGLLHAAKCYDYATYKTRFGTHATWWIWQAITRALAEKGQIIRVPVHVHTARGKLRRYEREQGEQEQEVVRQALNLSRDTYRLAKSSLHTLESLETVIKGDEDGHALRLADILVAPTTSGRLVLDAKQKEALHTLLQRVLQSREYEAIVLRYGLDGNEPRMLREAGVEMGITRERVRQLEKSAMLKLRRIAPRLKEAFSA